MADGNKGVRVQKTRLRAEIDVIEKDIYEKYGAKVLDILLCDRTRQYWAEKTDGAQSHPQTHHIIWAVDDYVANGPGFGVTDQIRAECIVSENHKTLLQPRAVKPLKVQRERTQKKAEVFTPAWVCNAQNNLVDEVWFGRKDVFNHENADHSWTTTSGKIAFPDGRSWQDYILDKRMEISCGEAPYLVSRYDVASGGSVIPVCNRIGILDRKLRVVNENCDTGKEWTAWARKAVESTYGFEWQGDNLLIARESVLVTWIENYRYKFHREPSILRVTEIAEIISWNIWQMDGLTYTIPFSGEDTLLEKYWKRERELKTRKGTKQLTFFHEPTTEQLQFALDMNEFKDQIHFCVIKDWSLEKHATVLFVDLVRGAKK